MPNIISGLIPSFPSTFRSNSNTPVATPLSSDSYQAKAPPPMKRPRGGHAGRVFETPQSHGLPHTGRDLKSIEPNGEETAPVRRSSRLKTTVPKAAAKVSDGETWALASGKTHDRHQERHARSVQQGPALPLPCHLPLPQRSKSRHLALPIPPLRRSRTTGCAISSAAARGHIVP